jgi:hypothetical protein
MCSLVKMVAFVKMGTLMISTQLEDVQRTWHSSCSPIRLLLLRHVVDPFSQPDLGLLYNLFEGMVHQNLPQMHALGSWLPSKQNLLVKTPHTRLY